MTLPTGTIALSQVNTELALPSTTLIRLGQSSVRTLAGVPTGPISMSNLKGKSNTFPFTISSNQTNANLRSLALAAGWGGTNQVIATINSGVYVSSNSTGTPALTVNGSFPAGVSIINNGVIVGMGGAGGAAGGAGNGPSQTAYPGSAGSAGGLALSVSVATSITNNNIIAGGGGGGGGGAGGAYGENTKSGFQYTNLSGGGGGGGQSSAAANSNYGGYSSIYAYGVPIAGTGTVGTSSAAGSGGAAGWYPDTASYYRIYSGAGGNGGGWGSTGSAGSSWGSPNGYTLLNVQGPYSGGSGGAAVSGNSNITWVATGTRYGSIT